MTPLEYELLCSHLARLCDLLFFKIHELNIFLRVVRVDVIVPHCATELLNELSTVCENNIVRGISVSVREFGWVILR